MPVWARSTVRGALPAFVTQKYLTGLVWFMNWGSKSTAVWSVCICGTAPMPDSGRPASGMDALDVSLSDPEYPMAAAGVNVTVREQEPPVAICVLQWFVASGMANSPVET